MSAVPKGNIERVKLLLNHGAQFTINSGLMTAIEKENLEMVRFLLKQGASVNFQTRNGATP